MGLVDLVLLSLCMNATCPGDNLYKIGLSATRKNRFADLAVELQTEHFKITTTENQPLSFTETVNNSLVGKGSAFDFLNILKKKYGFTYEVIKPKENSLEIDGNGMFTQLANGEADIAVAFLPVFPSYHEYFEYSKSLDEGEWVVLMKRPQESATGSGLWAPFTLNVWILILVTLLIVGPIFYLMILIETKLCKDEDWPLFPLPSCVWFVYGALLKQGSTLSPITDCSRMLFATWWIFITILTAFYTANLTAFLTLSKFTLPVAKPEDIGAKKFSWVSHKGSAVEESLKQNDEIKKKFDGSHGLYLDDAGEVILANWVAKSNYLYIGEKPIVEYLMYDDYMHRTDPTILENDRCTFVITQWNVLTTPRAFAFKKGFKYADLFNEMIEHLVESGIIRYKLREDLPNTQICPLDLGSKERQLRNSDLFMTYVIVGAGFIVSAVVFVVEWLMRYYTLRDITNKHQDYNNFIKEQDSYFKIRRKGEFKFANFKDNNNVKGVLWHEMDGTHYPPPPPYHALFKPPFANSPNGVRQTINGREYWVIKSIGGEKKLIPVRTPSALLFHQIRK